MAIGPLQSSKTATGGTRWSVLAQQAISFKKPPATKQPTGWEDTGEEVTLDDNDGEDAEW